MTVSLTFVTPPPGFAPLTDFSLTEIDGADGLFALQSLVDQKSRLYVLSAAVYLPTYSPVITDAQSESLELTNSNDALVLVIANPGEEGTTVNLMAPIVINSTNGLSAQFILEGQDWPMRAELAALAAAPVG